jgi:hypothetical protein
MSIPWQDTVTLALVAAAVIYLIWRLRRRRQHTGCDTCPDCPKPPAPSQLISIKPPKKDSYGDNTTA